MALTIRLESSTLQFKEGNHSAIDANGISHFVIKVDPGRLGEQQKWMFDNVSRKPSSRFILPGRCLASAEGTDFLLYEAGAPWTTSDHLKYRTRDILCGFHNLHHEMRRCHQNVSFGGEERSFVVSQYSGTVKLSGMMGCKECYNVKKKNTPCAERTRRRDIGQFVSFIIRLNPYGSEDEFTKFILDVDSLMQLIKHPPEVIYQHPVWCMDDLNKLNSRSILNDRLQSFFDSVNNADRVRIAAKCPTYIGWRKSVMSSILKDILSPGDGDSDGDDGETTTTSRSKGSTSVSGSKSRTSNKYNPPTQPSMTIADMRLIARFGRNVDQHHREYKISTSDAENALEELFPHFRTKAFGVMLHFKPSFDDWNLEKIR